MHIDLMCICLIWSSTRPCIHCHTARKGSKILFLNVPSTQLVWLNTVSICGVKGPLSVLSEITMRGHRDLCLVWGHSWYNAALGGAFQIYHSLCSSCTMTVLNKYHRRVISMSTTCLLPRTPSPNRLVLKFGSWKSRLIILEPFRGLEAHICNLYWLNDLWMDCIYIALLYPVATLKHFTILPNNHPFMLTFTHRRRCPCNAKTSSSGAVRVRDLAPGHLDIQLGGAGDGTSNLPVTSRPALPPVPNADMPICWKHESMKLDCI